MSDSSLILIANGPNLDLLGRRPESLYGACTLLDVESKLSATWAQWQTPGSLVFFQTNHEGELLDQLSAKPWSGMVLNPGAWTHTSLALADRIEALQLPFVEVHLSNLAKREPLRHHSFTASQAMGVIYGFGADSYVLGLRALMVKLCKLAPG
jgi:3-dehydroquinate dehydratase-2